MRKIALVNQKGGVGKTTTAVNLAAGAARLGKRILLVDLDPQSNATVHFGYRPHELKATLYEVLAGRKTAVETIVTTPAGPDLLPSNIELAGAEVELAGAIGRESILKDALEEVKGYDFVFVDCPPSLGILNVNGLTYVDEIFIPVQCEFFALQGISLLLRTIDRIKKRLHPTLTIGGIIACLYDVRRGLSKEVLTEIEKHFSGKLFKTRVRDNVRLAEAPSHGKTIFEYAPDSHGAEDYLALAREIVGTSEKQIPPDQSTEEPSQKATPAQKVRDKLPTFAEAMKLASTDLTKARSLVTSAEIVDSTRKGFNPEFLREIQDTKPDLTTKYPEGTIDRLADTLKDAEDAA